MVPRALILGHGPNGLEVAVLDSTAQPTATNLRAILDQSPGSTSQAAAGRRDPLTNRARRGREDEQTLSYNLNAHPAYQEILAGRHKPLLAETYSHRPVTGALRSIVRRGPLRSFDLAHLMLTRIVSLPPRVSGFERESAA